MAVVNLGCNCMKVACKETTLWQYSKTFLFGLCIGIVSERIIQWIFKKEVDNDCILFAPKTGCERKNVQTTCRSLSCSCCNSVKLFRIIESSKNTLDICMYLMTENELTKIVTSLFAKGIKVRIIIDKQMSQEAIKGDLVGILRCHIPIKLVDYSEMMHNKFVIIDKRILITGSFNWTRQAFYKNYENAIITQDQNIIRKYDEYFQNLWTSI